MLKKFPREGNLRNLRVIETARDEASINCLVTEGFFPLMKKVVQSKDIRNKYMILQSKKTKEIKVFTDFRQADNPEYEVVIDWSYYYPVKFLSPFAAYLIPSDIKVDEEVFVADLIEDFIGATWNQGDCFRLKSCEAIWNGTDLIIQYNPKNNRSDFIG